MNRPDIARCIMPKLTPGPWTIPNDRERRQAVIAGGCIPVYAPNDPTRGHAGLTRAELPLAWVGGAGRPMEQIIADAKAVAAAPELLAALRDLLRWGEQAGMYAPAHTQAARAAIAKAEGGQ
jgi:hypothetical protein